MAIELRKVILKGLSVDTSVSPPKVKVTLSWTERKSDFHGNSWDETKTLDISFSDWQAIVKGVDTGIKDLVQLTSDLKG